MASSARPCSSRLSCAASRRLQVSCPSSTTSLARRGDDFSRLGSLEPSAEIEVADAPPPSPATAFSGVEVTQTQEGVLIHLRADGMIAATESFTLEDPARLVVDLPGLDERYVGWKGGGCWRNGVPTRVSKESDLLNAIVGEGFKSRRERPSS